MIIGRKTGMALAVAMCGGTVAAMSDSGPEAAVSEIAYSFEVPLDGIALTGGASLALQRFPEGVPVFDDPGIANGLAVLCKLRDEAGAVVGFASELEVFPTGAQESFGAEEIVWDTVWTLTIPGRGSLYLVEQEHSGSLAAETIAWARENGRDWIGEKSMQTTVGPLEGGVGLIAGGSGEFEGASGTFVELVHMHRVTPEGAMTMTGELQLKLRSGE